MKHKYTQYDATYSGYHGKAERLFRNDPDLLSIHYLDWKRSKLLERRGDWMRLGRMHNMGAKFLRWLVDNDFLEREGRGDSIGAFKNAWYRVKRGPDDLGDLWVPDT